MKKRKAIRIISLLAAAALCLGGWGFWQQGRARQAERTVRYQGEYAFAALCEAVDGMDAALRKSRYALSGPMTASLCAEIYSRPGAGGDGLVPGNRRGLRGLSAAENRRWGDSDRGGAGKYPRFGGRGGAVVG